MAIESNLHNGLGIVRGNVFSFRRVVANLPDGVTLSDAYATLKTNYADADPGLFQKHITATNVASTGQIEDTGSVGVAVLRFDLTATNTLAATADSPYYYDIDVVTSAGDKLTIERGVTSFQERVGQP